MFYNFQNWINVCPIDSKKYLLCTTITKDQKTDKCSEGFGETGYSGIK